MKRRINRTSGFTVYELAVSITVVAVLAAGLTPLGSSLIDSGRAMTTEEELKKIYTAIAGNPKQNFYGYLGDVGDYPSSLLDLVSPSPVPAGWNGPYLSEARIDGGILYDAFGGPIEYFQPAPGALPSAPTDQLALISRGPDRDSTNLASNPNERTAFTDLELLPSNPAYAGTADNADNISYPYFTDNVKLLDYQSLGHLSINISNFDDAPNVSALLPGCPNYYDIAVTSVSRNSTEAYVSYAPGGASFDLLQGLYLIKVFVSGSSFPIWQEQIAIRPGDSTTRNLSLTGVNSSLSSTTQLIFFNGLADPLEFYQGAVSLGTIIGGANNAASPFSANRCSRILVQNTSTNVLVDSYVQPNGPSPITRRYDNDATCTMTFANETHSTVAIYADNLLLGTVGRRGNKRARSFAVHPGVVLTFKNENNVAISSSNLGAAHTVVCPASTAAQF
jgi:hypothetical protein